MRAYVEQLACADAYIACNGAEIWSPAHELLHHVVFPEETALAVCAFARRHGAYAQTYDDRHFYYLLENHFAREYAATSALTGFHTPDIEGFIRLHPTSKILLMDTPEKAAAMLAEARELFAGQASVTCSKPHFVEFNPPEATKGNALRRCAELLDFRLEDTLAFGDSLNDLSMLQAAGLGCAVANAREDVLARVKTVCGSNMEDGPARLAARLLWGEVLP
jgi:Cof subfamily protein (haloacid dehalogenase superfamily)